MKLSTGTLVDNPIGIPIATGSYQPRPVEEPPQWNLTPRPAAQH